MIKFCNKFKVGDKVVINTKSRRLPEWIKGGLFTSQHRTVVALYYNAQTQHTEYYLGYNHRGLDISFYPFRAEMLKKYKMKLHTRRLKMKIGGGRV